MVFINESQTVYTILNSISQTTGSLFLTILMLVILIVVVFLVLGLSIEWSAIFVMPFLLVLMAVDAGFYPVGGVILIYLGFIMAKNFFFTK